MILSYSQFSKGRFPIPTILITLFALQAWSQDLPLNDDFTNRIALTGTANFEQADNSLATMEPGEPGIAPYPISGKTLWWSYTAPEKGVLRVHAEGLTFGACWGVFRGQDFSNLTLAASLWGPQWLSVDIDTGEEVQIAVDGTFGGAGALTLQTTYYPIPPNDSFSNSIALEGTNVAVAGSNIAATVEPGEPGNPAGQTVWYSWTAPTTGKATLSTGYVDCALAVYLGDTLDQLTLLKACGDGSGDQRSFLAIEGTVYRIQVDVSSMFGPVEFLLTLNLLPCATAPNDNFTNAYAMDGASYPYGEWITLATTEPGEPAHLDGQPCKSLWWQWEAPVNGKLDLWRGDWTWYKPEQLASLATNLTFAVYTGSAVDALTLVGKRADRVIVDVTCRTKYRIAVVADPSADGEADFLAGFTPNSTPVVVPWNLLCDPSFDTSQPGCWNVLGTNAIWMTPGAMDGQFCMYLGSTSLIYQDFPTVPGKLYRFRFAYSCNSDQGSIPVNVSWDDTLLDQVQVPADQEGIWNWAEFLLTASNTTSRVAFDNQSTNVYAYFYIDATSVVCMNEAPSILASPVSASTVTGGTVAFAVQGKGTEPLSYQWFFNDSPMAGQTTASLSLSDVTTNDAGLYSAVVTNPFGAVTSAPAMLTVEAPSQPTIVLEPYSDVIPVGAYFSLAIAAVGSLPLYYQWFQDGVPIQDATNRHLVFDSFQSTNAGTYTVSVSNAYASVLSLPATLVATTTNLGGGVVVVANRFRDVADYYELPIYDVDGVTKLSSADSDYVAQLYAGPSVESLRPAGTLRPFLTGLDAGIFEGEWVQLPTVQAGSLAYAQLRAWQRNYGMSYEEARSLGSKFGRSPLFAVVPGGNAPGFPPTPAAYLDNLRSFKLEAGSPEFQAGRIQFVTQQPEGSLTWALIGNAGYRYLIEKASTNLVFQPFLVLTNVTGSVNFSDTPGTGQAFYRARILE
jgi:hypothetical protein